ncbi:DUF4238 domain-containing protein [Bradyrhizobium sp. CCGUVB4N]|uniref:DUF4238 domain-containing protein n=1 Tax=Bradyrhizobium sp. CCGUVB4N TaxID=2949631 RepID=UPI0020B44BC2|nr:DUF4238 domain-containing protein [Bradyrhizobium sp. CCGUVB4N]MCP3386184.1 DUF4238 domain-containing protein [Bradyrhizobium sp. CCGUVB4N]
MPKEPNHHYIPEFYLQEWADGETRQLIEFCRRHKDVVVARPTAPAGTGYVPGLYKDRDAPKGEEYVIEERLMSSIDNWASKALQQFKTMGSLPGSLESQEALGWCRFLYSLIVRNPDHLEVIREKLRTMDRTEILEYVRDDYPRIRRPEDPENFDEYKADFIKSPPDIDPVKVLPTLMRSKRVFRVIASFKWHTMTMNTPKYPLLTSDRPVIMTNGLVSDHAHLVMPIGPRRLFIATRTMETFESFKQRHPKEFAKAINDRICLQARKFVYGSDKSQLRFVSNRLGRRVWSSPIG